MNDFFYYDIMFPAMLYDASEEIRPMTFYVDSLIDITDSFDEVAYYKCKDESFHFCISSLLTFSCFSFKCLTHDAICFFGDQF